MTDVLTSTDLKKSWWVCPYRNTKLLYPRWKTRYQYIFFICVVCCAVGVFVFKDIYRLCNIINFVGNMNDRTYKMIFMRSTNASIYKTNDSISFFCCFFCCFFWYLICMHHVSVCPVPVSFLHVLVFCHKREREGMRQTNSINEKNVSISIQNVLISMWSVFFNLTFKKNVS